MANFHLHRCGAFEIVGDHVDSPFAFHLSSGDRSLVLNGLGTTATFEANGTTILEINGDILTLPGIYSIYIAPDTLFHPLNRTIEFTKPQRRMCARYIDDDDDDPLGCFS